MSVDTGQLITVGIFLGTQALSLVWTISSMKGDNRVLRANMDGMKEEMAELKNVLVTLADVKGELRLIQERGMMQGARIDDMQRRVNRRLDREEEERESA